MESEPSSPTEQEKQQADDSSDEFNKRLPKHLQSPSGSNRTDKTHPNLMPYPIESLEEMDTHLELIIQHLLEAAQAKDFELLSHLNQTCF
jgi:hypothetical protein